MDLFVVFDEKISFLREQRVESKNYNHVHLRRLVYDLEDLTGQVSKQEYLSVDEIQKVFFYLDCLTEMNERLKGGDLNYFYLVERKRIQKVSFELFRIVIVHRLNEKVIKKGGLE